MRVFEHSKFLITQREIEITSAIGFNKRMFREFVVPKPSDQIPCINVKFINNLCETLNFVV